MYGVFSMAEKSEKYLRVYANATCPSLERESSLLTGEFF